MTDRDKALADFLARKGATKCPPAESFADQAKPLRRARANLEQRLTDGEPTGSEWDSHVQAHEQERERLTERRYLEIQGVRD